MMSLMVALERKPLLTLEGTVKRSESSLKEPQLTLQLTLGQRRGS